MAVAAAAKKVPAARTPTKPQAAPGPAPQPPSRRRNFTPLTPMRQETAKRIRKLADQVQASHPDMTVHDHLRDAARVLESGNEEGAQRHLRAAAFSLSPLSLMRNGLHTDDAHQAARLAVHGVHRQLLLVKDIVDAGERNRAAIARLGGEDDTAPRPPADPNNGYGPGALAQKPTARQPPGDRALNAPAKADGGGSDPNAADPVGAQPKGSKQFAYGWGDLSRVIELVGPHGYIHGWIFVGIPGAGQKVTLGAGKHRTGTVEGADATHLHVRMADGSLAHVAHNGGSGDGVLAKVPSAVPQYSSTRAGRDQLGKALTAATGGGSGKASSAEGKRAQTEQLARAVSGHPQLASDEVLNEHVSGMRASLNAGDVPSFSAHRDAVEARIRQHGMMPAGDLAAAPKAGHTGSDKQLSLLGERMNGPDKTSGVMKAGDMQEGFQAIGQAPNGIVPGKGNSDPWWMAGPGGTFAVSVRQKSGGTDKRVLVPWDSGKQRQAEADAVKATKQHGDYFSGGSSYQQALAKTAAARAQHEAASAKPPSAARVSSPEATAARKAADNVRLEPGLTRGQREEAEQRLYKAAQHLDAGNHEEAASELDAAMHATSLRGGGIIKGSTAAQARDLRDKVRAARPAAARAPQPIRPAARAAEPGTIPKAGSQLQPGDHIAGLPASTLVASTSRVKGGTRITTTDGKMTHVADGQTLPVHPAVKPLKTMSGSQAADRMTAAATTVARVKAASSMTDGELAQANQELARRAALLGKPGQPSKGHQQVLAEMKQRGIAMSVTWDDLAAVVELSAQTAQLEATPAPRGKPGGPGLYDVAGMGHTNYEQQIVKALIEKRGMDPHRAYAVARGAIRKWMRGGGHVRPEVQAAAAKAESGELARQARAKAVHGHAASWDDVARDIKLATVLEFFNPAQPRLPVGPGGGQFAAGGGAPAASGQQPPAQQAAAKQAPAQTPQQKAAAAAAAKASAAHAAHVAHVAHVNGVSTQKANLLVTAQDDRQKAAGLIKQRNVLLKALQSAAGKTSSGQAGAKTSTTAKTKTTAPKAAGATSAKASTTSAKASTTSTSAPKKSTAKTGTASTSKTGTGAAAAAPKAGSTAAIKAQIGQLNTQINQLLAQANQAQTQAATMK